MSTGVDVAGRNIACSKVMILNIYGESEEIRVIAQLGYWVLETKYEVGVARI
jgi:hypothetical protein